MSISSALNNALSGLNANGRLADLTSNNIANALTPGYARKVANLQAKVLDGSGAGVRVDSVDRLYAKDLTSARRIADGQLAYEVARTNALEPMARLVGDINDVDSLFAKYQGFESGLRNLADSPESAARQLDAVLAARDIANKFRELAGGTQKVRQSAESEIGRQVDRVNSDLEQIAKLNRQIRTFRAGNRDASALEDQRERLVDEVASIIPIRTEYADDATLMVLTKQGVVLATTSSTRLEFSARAIVTPDMEYAGGTGILSGLVVDGIDVTPGGGGAQAVTGGSLAGLFETRDALAPQFQQQIDALAAELIGRFETAGLDATLPPGAPGLFTDNGGALNPADIVGLSSRIAVNASVDPASGGDPARMRDGLGAVVAGPSSNATFAFAMLDVFTEARDASPVPGLTGMRSSAETIATFSELRSSQRIETENRQSALRAGRETLATSESEAIGVDTDTELQQLLLIEQAYAANAQVVRTAAAMLDELRDLT